MIKHIIGWVAFAGFIVLGLTYWWGSLVGLAVFVGVCSLLWPGDNKLPDGFKK